MEEKCNLSDHQWNTESLIAKWRPQNYEICLFCVVIRKIFILTCYSYFKRKLILEHILSVPYPHRVTF